MENKSLTEALNERRANWEEKANDTVKEIYNNGVKVVATSGILEGALQVGQSAPDFILNNALGNAIQLSDALAEGPVVLTWYRGGWCPYCNLTLRYLQNALPQFQNYNATLIALTPELPDKSLSTSEKLELEFEVLSDIGNAVAKNYGIVFKLPADVAEIYSQNFDLPSYNGDDSKELPLAATYVIDQKGLVQYAFLDAEYRNRAEIDAILTALKNL